MNMHTHIHPYYDVHRDVLSINTATTSNRKKEKQKKNVGILVTTATATAAIAEELNGISQWMVFVAPREKKTRLLLIY